MGNIFYLHIAILLACMVTCIGIGNGSDSGSGIGIGSGSGSGIGDCNGDGNVNGSGTGTGTGTGITAGIAMHKLTMAPLHLPLPERGMEADTSVNRLPLHVIAAGLNDASSIYITPDNDLYLVESGANRILRLDKNGLRLDSLGRMGFGDYRFDRPFDVDATNGLKIYVSDYNNRRIQIFDRRLQFLSTIDLTDITGHGRAYRPTRIAVNAFGELFVLDEEQKGLLKYDRNGRFDYSVDLQSTGIRDMPISMALTGDMIFLADPAGGVIHLISDSGSYERFIGGIDPVYALTAFGGSVWAASGSMVYKLDRRGRVLREFGIEGVDTIVSVAAGKEYLFLLDSGRIHRAVIPSRD